MIYYDSLITMDFAGTNSSICDRDGNLLMYTNGMQIHGSDHKPILNGDTIAYSDLWEFWSIDEYYENGEDWVSGLPIVQGTLMLPLSDSEDEFIVIYQILPRDEEGSYVSSLNYSLVSRDEGSKYKITKKDETIREDNLNFGQIHACLHGNGRDWWLIQQSEEGDSVFIYMITKDDIKLQKEIKKESRGEVTITTSQVTFSPHGELYAVANGQYLHEIGGERGTVLRVFKFDRCVGDLIETGTDTIDNFGIRGSVAFSPGGQYMYTTSHEEIYQYDMTETDWVGSKRIISTYDGFTFQYTENSTEYRTRFVSMALAPDGRIYSVPNGSNRFLNVIEYPDEEGQGAGVIQHKIMMPTENFSSIPNLPNYKMGPKEGSLCDTLGMTNYLESQFRFIEDTTNYLKVRFTDISYFSPEEWLWDFGDGTTYNGQKPYYHEYEESGAYHVCLTIRRSGETDKFCKTIYLGVTSNKEEFLSPDQIVIYPNPVEDILHIELRDHIPKDLIIRVYNTIGELIIVKRMRSSWNQLALWGKPSGIYYFTLLNTEGRIYTGTFIKL